MSILVLFTTICTQAQIYGVGLELSYPIPTDRNFIGKNYQGIADFGIRFRMNNMNSINFGLSLNAGMLSQKTDEGSFNVNAYTIQPRLYFGLNHLTIERFHPYISGGYSLLISKVSGS